VPMRPVPLPYVAKAIHTQSHNARDIHPYVYPAPISPSAPTPMPPTPHRQGRDQRVSIQVKPLPVAATRAVSLAPSARINRAANPPKHAKQLRSVDAM